MKSQIEEQLAWQLRVNEQLPAGVREFRFHPKRKWRLDFAWPEARVGLEVEGGVWTQGRHTRGTGFSEDCVKYNEAQLLGWKVLRVTGEQVEDGSAVDWVRRALGEEGKERSPF